MIWPENTISKLYILILVGMQQLPLTTDWKILRDDEEEEKKQAIIVVRWT